MELKARFPKTRWMYVSVFLFCSLVGIAGAEAANRFWIGSRTGNTQFENIINWSATLNGAGGETVPGVDDIAIMTYNLSGSALTTIQIRSSRSVKGIILNQVWTGSLLLGTGSITVGTNGVRMGSGRIIGGTGSLAIAGSFTQTGGILRSGNTPMTISGSVAITGSTAKFTSTGTIVLDGTTQTLNTGNRPLTNLTVESTTSTTLASDQSITGTLQISTGATLALSSFTTYATGATIINYGTITEGTGKIEHSASSVLITDSSYAEDNSLVAGTIYLTVTDSDENISGTAQDTIAVTVTLSNGDSEPVTLTETNLTSGIFRGSIPATTSTDYVASDGYVEVTATSTLTLSYTDAQDLEAVTDTGTFTVAAAASSSSTATTQGSGARRGSGGGRVGNALSGSTGGASSNVTGATPSSQLTAAQKAQVRRQARLQLAKEMKARAAARAELRRAKWKTK